MICMGNGEVSNNNPSLKPGINNLTTFVYYMALPATSNSDSLQSDAAIVQVIPTVMFAIARVSCIHVVCVDGGQCKACLNVIN